MPDLIFLVAGKLFFLWYRLLFPLMFTSPLKAVCFDFLNLSHHDCLQLALFLIVDSIASAYFGFSFGINHNVDDAVRPEPDQENKMHRDWAELQIVSTMDYATDSWLCTFGTGGLNHQTTHHLFPGISQIHYPAITPIVIQTCKEYGIKYSSTSGYIKVGASWMLS